MKSSKLTQNTQGFSPEYRHMRYKKHTYICIKALFFSQNNLRLLKQFMLEGTSGYQHPAQSKANSKVRSNAKFRPGCAESYLSCEHLKGWSFHSLYGPLFQHLTTRTVTPSISSEFFLWQFVFIITKTKHAWASGKLPKVLVLKELSIL